MTQNTQPVFPARGLLFLIGPGVAYVSMQVVALGLGAKPLLADQSFGTVGATAEWAEAASRIALLGYMMLFFAGALGILIKTVIDVFNLLDLASRLNVLIGGLTAAVLAILTLAPAGAIPRYRDLVGEPIYAAAIKANAAMGANWGQLEVGLSATIIAVCVAVAAGCLAIQIVSCVGSFGRISAGDSWRFQFERLKFYTYLASMLMIVGLLTNRAWISYPLYVVSNPAASEALKSLVNAFTMYLGIGYTLIIGSASIPVSYWLYSRANQIVAESRDTPLPREQAPFHSVLLNTDRQKAGLVITPQDVLKSIIAVLGPFAAGSVANLAVLA